MAFYTSATKMSSASYPMLEERSIFGWDAMYLNVPPNIDSITCFGNNPLNDFMLAARLDILGLANNNTHSMPDLPFHNTSVLRSPIAFSDLDHLGLLTDQHLAVSQTASDVLDFSNLSPTPVATSLNDSATTQGQNSLSENWLWLDLLLEPRTPSLGMLPEEGSILGDQRHFLASSPSPQANHGGASPIIDLPRHNSSYITPASTMSNRTQELVHRKQKQAQRPIQCPMCPHTSLRANNMKEHIRTHDPNRPKTHLCSICGKPFARKYDMVRHTKSHSTRRKKGCSA